MKNELEKDVPETDAYEELHDVPSKSRLRLSWIGKFCLGIVIFWIIIALFGSYLDP